MPSDTLDVFGRKSIISFLFMLTHDANGGNEAAELWSTTFLKGSATAPIDTCIYM